MAYFNAQAAPLNGMRELGDRVLRAINNGWRRALIWDPFNAGVDARGSMRWDGWSRLTDQHREDWDTYVKPLAKTPNFELIYYVGCLMANISVPGDLLQSLNYNIIQPTTGMNLCFDAQLGKNGTADHWSWPFVESVYAIRKAAYVEPIPRVGDPDKYRPIVLPGGWIGRGPTAQINNSSPDYIRAKITCLMEGECSPERVAEHIRFCDSEGIIPAWHPNVVLKPDYEPPTAGQNPVGAVWPV